LLFKSCTKMHKQENMFSFSGLYNSNPSQAT
jgi:hypothetical protein